MCLCMKQLETRGSKGQLLGGQCVRPVTGGICILYMHRCRIHFVLGNLIHILEGLGFYRFYSPFSHSPTAVTQWSPFRLKSIIFQFPATVLTTNVLSSAAGPHPAVRVHSEISHQWHQVSLDYFLVVGSSWSSKNRHSLFDPRKVMNSELEITPHSHSSKSKIAVSELWISIRNF